MRHYRTLFLPRPEDLLMRQEDTPGAALISSALANDQSDVIVLFMRAELFNSIDNRRYHRLWRQFSVRFERFDQTPFAELFPCLVERFGHSVGI